MQSAIKKIGGRFLCKYVYTNQNNILSLQHQKSKLPRQEDKVGHKDMTNEELYDLLSFEENLESVEIKSIDELKHDGVFVQAKLHYPDQDMKVSFVYYKGKDWLFTPSDWQGWNPDGIDQLGEIEWRINDTSTRAIIYDGQPALSPFTEEPDVIRNESRERIGRELRKAREKAGLTLRQLADITGIAFNHIGRIERGKYNVTLDTLSILAQALGMEVGIVKYVPVFNSLEDFSKFRRSNEEMP